MSERRRAREEGGRKEGSRGRTWRNFSSCGFCCRISFVVAWYWGVSYSWTLAFLRRPSAKRAPQPVSAKPFAQVSPKLPAIDARR